jgi:hypothetical protein
VLETVLSHLKLLSRLGKEIAREGRYLFARLIVLRYSFKGAISRYFETILLINKIFSKRRNLEIKVFSGSKTPKKVKTDQKIKTRMATTDKDKDRLQTTKSKKLDCDAPSTT